MTMQSWIDSEPGVRDTCWQAARLLRGGFRRPVVTILTTLLLVSLLVGELAFTKHVYSPRLVLRVVEMEQDPLSLPRPRHDLSVYIREAIWTDEALLKIIDRHHLYASRRQDSRSALESFRRDIDVDVYQNYFVQERSASDPPRSARVVIRFRSVDSDEAIEVTRALGTLVVDHELESRADQAARAAADVDRDLARTHRAQLDLRAEIAAKQRERSLAPLADPRLQVELVSMLGSLESLEKHTLALERRDALLSFGAAVEKQRLGLRFTVVDDGALPLSGGRGHGRLVGVGLIALMLVLPLVALGVGAISLKEGVKDGLA
jgi:hypothetical protein